MGAWGADLCRHPMCEVPGSILGTIPRGHCPYDPSATRNPARGQPAARAGKTHQATFTQLSLPACRLPNPEAPRLLLPRYKACGLGAPHLRPHSDSPETMTHFAFTTSLLRL